MTCVEKEGTARKICRFIVLVAYYGFAIYFPRFPNHSIGKKIRGFLCQFIFRKSGKNINVERMTQFGAGKNIELGSNSGIGIHTQICGVDVGELIIGDDVMMVPEVIILTLGHGRDNIGMPTCDQRDYATKVIIEDDVWIGIRAIVLRGLKLAKGQLWVLVLLLQRICHHILWWGVPAKVIKRRG